MTREEIIEMLIIELNCVERQDTPLCNRHCESCDLVMPTGRVVKAYEQAIDILHQEPCDDAISRDMALEKMADYVASGYADSAEDFEEYSRIICQLPPVTQKAGKCKECKYFEYDSVAKVDGIPLIVAHEICNKWGNGCKTSEDGYCYLFEPQERSKE